MLQVPIDKILPVTEARANISKLVDDVEKGDIYVLTRGGKPVVVVASVEYIKSLTEGKTNINPTVEVAQKTETPVNNIVEEQNSLPKEIENKPAEPVVYKEKETEPAVAEEQETTPQVYQPVNNQSLETPKDLYEEEQPVAINVGKMSNY